MTRHDRPIPDFLRKHGVTSVSDNTDGKVLSIETEIATFFSTPIADMINEDPGLIARMKREEQA